MLLSEIVLKADIRYEITDDVEVKGLSYDSRKIEEGFVFFAIPGFKEDGSKYIQAAINKKAIAIICDKRVSIPELKIQPAIIPVSDVRLVMAKVACIFFNNPSNYLKLAGVTGTNGKTTITFILKSIFESAGIKTGLIGTLGYQYNNILSKAMLTTPESIELNSIMSDMRAFGVNACAMEVSSVALDLDRVTGLDFDIGIFSNLTPEHLDFHNSMNDYFLSKKKFFDELKPDAVAVSNADDEFGEAILEDTKAGKVTYSLLKNSDYKVTNYSLSLDGSEFTIEHHGEKYFFVSNLTGKFNLYNLAAGIATSFEMKIDYKSIKSAIETLAPVDGRFNLIKLPNDAYTVIDYSHTSDSLKNAIESAINLINESDSGGRVITIFGCGGNRDRLKRPVMGKYATELSDYVIITSDNPRFENPDSIIDEIVAGIENKTNFERITDRELAIKRGIELSKSGDLILICGKGHETYQEVKGIRSHFDDKEIVSKYMNLTVEKRDE